MLNSYISTSQTLIENAPIEFDINKLNTNCCVEHIAGSTTFTLKGYGFYQVNFNGIASATDTATDPIIIQLFNGSDEVEGALASALSGASDTPMNLAFSTIIQVRPSCCAIDNTASLTFRNVGIEAEYTNANVVITKL